MATNSFSLHELNQHLKKVIAFNMRQALWINCEVSEVSQSNGHVYLSLVERDDYQLKARANAMIWRKDLKKISQKVGDSLWSILQVGRQVLLLVEVEFHEFHGLKLKVKDLDPSITIGQLELQRLQALQKLKNEKFTELNRQLEAPLVWQRLAVISSSNAAGWQDFKNQLEQNPYQYYFDFQLFEAAMQGVNMVGDIIRQLEKIDESKEKFDAIVIIRGGGAKLDLMGFDAYNLCVAIATAERPVLTGIGHEIDETLADLVAYQSLKTPTAVADFLIHQSFLFEAQIQELYSIINQKINHKIQQEFTQLEQLERQIKRALQQKLTHEKDQLNRLEQKLKLLHPQNILDRGFTAILDEQGQLISSVQQLQKGKEYTLQLADGKIKITL